MSTNTEFPTSEIRVLAVSSHVVSGHVGNKIAVFVLQALGCDVAALNTVHFSNHTGYGFVKGTRATAEQISDLYDGLKLSRLDDFDMILSGYIPGAAAVEAVGRIGKELRAKNAAAAAASQEASPGEGGFFWVLDPVMGDNGRLYVAEDSVAAYKALIPHVDLILPNQFEAELLSGVKIVDMATMAQAVESLHETYGVPHIVITSVQLPECDVPAGHMCVIGSSMRQHAETGQRARIFKIVFPAIDVYFSGTGDMFSALAVVRMREAVEKEQGEELIKRRAWLSSDAVAPTDLPLARAVEKVLGSMHQVLEATQTAMKEENTPQTTQNGDEDALEAAKRAKSASSRAAELRLVRNTRFLRDPAVVFHAEPL